MPLLPGIEQSADTAFERAGIGPLPPCASTAELEGALAILVAGSPAVGFARIEQVGGAAHLEQLSVHPDAAGEGVGTELLSAACDWSRRHGFRKITLLTFRDVAWNGPFYERNGFAVAAEPSPPLRELVEHERQLGLERLGVRVVMEKPLG
jgi:GNAT superfamily N-acetyltransferase